MNLERTDYIDQRHQHFLTKTDQHQRLKPLISKAYHFDVGLYPGKKTSLTFSGSTGLNEHTDFELFPKLDVPFLNVNIMFTDRCGQNT